MNKLIRVYFFLQKINTINDGVRANVKIFKLKYIFLIISHKKIYFTYYSM